MRTIVSIIGTRPEAIKMAPVIAALKGGGWARCVVVATAQHRDLLDQMLGRLDVQVDHDLDLITVGQSPWNSWRGCCLRWSTCYWPSAPMRCWRGDTTTVLVAALAAFHQREFPLATSRRGCAHLLSARSQKRATAEWWLRVARWHFAPTAGAAAHLRQEGIAESNIHLTGNTGIDTLLNTVRALGEPSISCRRMILLTAHRRESLASHCAIFLPLCERSLIATRIWKSFIRFTLIRMSGNARNLCYPDIPVPS